MRHLKESGFIIKRTNLFDSDRFITIFTKKNGKVEMIARGVRKITSRRSSHIELLNHVNFQSIKTKKNYVLTEIEVIDSFYDLKEDYSKIGAIFLICELVDKFCPVAVSHEDIYNLIKSTLGLLREQDLSSSIFEFQVKLLTLLGFWDESRKFKSVWEIDRYIENLTERKIKTKNFFKI